MLSFKQFTVMFAIESFVGESDNFALHVIGEQKD